MTSFSLNEKKNFFFILSQREVLVVGNHTHFYLPVQPEVISAVLSNKVFRGRDLTARFLYSAPESFVGRRKFNSLSVDAALEGDYQKAVTDLLTDEYCGEPEVITVSEEAGRLIGDFASEIESRIGNEYKDIAHWVGKLAGNTVRIAGLLCRAETTIDRGLFAVKTRFRIADTNVIPASLTSSQKVSFFYSLIVAEPNGTETITASGRSKLHKLVQ